MKISLKLANGATLEFEGDQEEFDRISGFLAEPPDSLTAEAPTGSAASLTPNIDREPDESRGWSQERCGNASRRSRLRTTRSA
ncbi:MAG: hypothetical protein E6G45_11400 [Actinobacteria bacterium]|nr:MAG: hypothetical protein E6G45_11400 [Actinomycetota bacterium]